MLQSPLPIALGKLDPEIPGARSTQHHPVEKRSIQGFADQYHDAFYALAKHKLAGRAPLINGGSITAESYRKVLFRSGLSAHGRFKHLK